MLEPQPGETPLWEQIKVEVLFEQSKNPEHLITELQQQLAKQTLDNIETTFIKDQVWERAWMDRFRPMAFGNRLWIYPTHIPPSDNNTINVLLDPGLAFGTGTHPTTALCLRWLDNQNLENKTVLDYGCGSGVLAIAAAKLGAKKVYASDIDSQALTATHSNAELNTVEKKLEILPSDQLPTLDFDIVIANILSNILIELSSLLSNMVKPNGYLVLSGILNEQEKSIVDAFQNQFVFSPSKQQEQWLLLEALKKPPPRA